MRSSSGGCVMKQAHEAALPSEMPKALSACPAAARRLTRLQALERRDHRSACRRGARRPRRRGTRGAARTSTRSCSPGCRAGSARRSSRRRSRCRGRARCAAPRGRPRWPITRDRKSTKVFTTPWISVSVTMSPFATWLTSWPSTASTSSRFMRCSSPVLTATSAAVAARAGREGVRRVGREDRHLRHADARRLGLVLHGLDAATPRRRSRGCSITLRAGARAAPSTSRSAAR